MVRINLLPWRDRALQKKQKRFIVFITLSCFTALIINAAIYVFYHQNLEKEKLRTKFLEEKVAVLDFRLKKIKDLEEKIKEILKRKEAIEEIQSRRFNIVLLLNELKDSIPNSIFLTSLEEQDEKLVLVGRSDSETAIALFISALERSPHFESPKLKIIEKKQNDRKFEIRVSFSPHYGTD